MVPEPATLERIKTLFAYINERFTRAGDARDDTRGSGKARVSRELAYRTVLRFVFFWVPRAEPHRTNKCDL